MIHQSKNCYKGTEVLINHAGIRNERELVHYEKMMTRNRLAQLELSPILGKFDLRHLCRIHEYIFQDVYSFAGKVRDEDIAKEVFHFCLAKFIRFESERIFTELKNEKYLKNLSLDDFSNRAAYFLAEINVLHPFREGNGRSQREFIRVLALSNGYDINWSKVDKNEFLEASKRSIANTKPLEHCIRKCITESKKTSIAI